MANRKHVETFLQGVSAWNSWREKHPDISPDLTDTNLLKERSANSNANDLTFHLPDLSGIDLHDADLRGAILGGEDSSGLSYLVADFRSANLRHARLEGAVLKRSDLRGADLFSARLHEADLSWAELGEANLSQTLLFHTVFRDSNHDHANLEGAELKGSIFSGVDLSTVQGLESIVHNGPSYVSVDTLYRSVGRIPDTFLRGCGVPENLITFMHSFARGAFEFYSCFISHSAKDRRFCERLYADLQAKNVRVWYFPEDAKWGEPVWGEIDRSIKVYDKLVVACSENSLQSGPVNREIERALNREDKEGKSILFPIRIDDYIFDKWEHARKADVLAKVVGDFSGWDADGAKYEKAFDKLLEGLQAEI